MNAMTKTSLKGMKKAGVVLHALPENEFPLIAIGLVMQMDPFPHGKVAPIQY